MDLSKIITISGKSGLYKVVSETRNGMLAESLTDGRKIPVFSTDRSSALEDISVFASGGEIPLKEVLWKIHEHEGDILGIDPKADPKAAKAKFEEILPDYDRDRVYFSDIKKIFSWYNLLLDKDMISKPEPAEEEKDTSEKDADSNPQDPSEKTAEDDVLKNTDQTKASDDGEQPGQ